MKKIEKRIHPRRPYRTKVIFEDELGEGLFFVQSSDISMGGLFLSSDIPLSVGTLMFLSFQLPGHKRPIRVTGQVVRRADAGGMGVRFVGLSEAAEKRLSEFLSG
jgi:uncharacterized protein (TIGR02266 family)